jgi:hypothetical protein
MKKRAVLISSICCSLYFAPAQPRDSTSFRVSETEVELLYNHYLQDGNRSAITGGQGSEKLTVYGPALKVKHHWGRNTVSGTIGSDVITSVSTDRIDFVMSSVSLHDARSYGQAQYAREVGSSGLTLSAGMGASIESDYFSLQPALGVQRSSADGMREASARLQLFQDDLRWGRLDQGEWRPQYLIYPAELRGENWYPTFRRQSWLLNLGYRQVVSRRDIVGIFAVLGHQRGLLATPFHRVYFTDGRVAVEQLPQQRQKVGLSLKWSRFVKGRWVVKSTVDGYGDSFGILALSGEVIGSLKLRPKWTLRSSLRGYAQQGADFYAPYAMHDPEASWYTSDPDLSGFQSIQVGLGGSYRPDRAWGKRNLWQELSLRYRFYYRSNGLTAHMMSLVVKLARRGKFEGRS